MNTPQDTVLVRYIRKKSSSIERNQVEDWLKSDDKNQQYLDNLSQLWLTREKKYRDYMPSAKEGWRQVQSRIDSKPVVPLHKWYHTVYKVAAVMAVVSAIVFLFVDREQSSDSLHTIAALEHAEKHTLSDGSIVTLNSGSSLSYSDAFGTNQREVKLSGEAFFEVSRDESRPFIIETGNTQTTVLGTSFNILQSDDIIEVSVVSGKVTFGQLSTNKEVTLTKGEMGVQEGSMLSKELISDPNFLAWKTRKLVFNNQPLEIIIKDISKVYRASFIIENTTNRKMTVEFDNQSLEEVLEVIASTLDVTISSTATGQYNIK